MIRFFSILLLCGIVFSNPTCPEVKPDMVNVHLVCHTHDDVGWLKTVDEYYYGSRKDITSVGVQYILDSVIPFLVKDPLKKFIFVESSFFFRWWDEQSDTMKDKVKQVVENGQLEFINGGWVMNDEAGCHYNSIIDQMTVGLVRLNETFGPVAFPRIGWQIDPFGHSSEQASLFAQMGMDGEFYARIDYRDKDTRWNNNELEMIYKSSPSLGSDSWIFTGVLPHHYEAPSGFCFDNLCGDDPIMDDPRLEDYNKDDKVNSFIDAVNDQLTGYISKQNIIMAMGSDFHYVNANSWYKNLDKLIKYVNELQVNGSNVNLIYSTPSCYVDALHSENISWPIKSDDFFPYATDQHSYWTGYFTSRPTLKGFEKQGNNILQAVKQLASLTGSDKDESITTLAEALGVAQHHDAITGTSKQHVADDYSVMLNKGVEATRSLLSKGFSYVTGNDESTEFTFCPLLNISSCSFVEGKTSFVVNVYNSIGRPKSFYVRVPVEDSLDYNVQDQYGNFLETQVTPLPDQILTLPGRTSTAQYDLIFYAQDIPALGSYQYLVEGSSEAGTNGRKSVLSKKKEIIDGKDTEIENKNLKLVLDGDTNKLKGIAIKTKEVDLWANYNVTQDYKWYKGHNGDNSSPDNRASGAYIFRPDGDNQEVSDLVISTIYEGPLVEEIHQEWTSWVTQVLRTYQDKNYLEIEWLVGSIPVDDDVGKEIINLIEFEDFITNNTFYTDSNGRELIKRIKDYRATYVLPLDDESVSRNYYPVTAQFVLDSLNGKGSAAVLNDRAQGGTSLTDGQIELMVHRRLLHDDAFGAGEALNEEAYGVGLVARGRHLLIHSDMATDECDFGCQRRTIAEEILLQPIITFSDSSTFVTLADGTEAKSGLSAPLPDNIHLLTLEPWSSSGTWLLRLENFYAVDESSKSGNVDVDVESLFSEWTVSNVRELILGANAFKEDVVRYQWNTQDEETKHVTRDERKVKISEAVYPFAPMQIRTFLVDVAQ